MGTHIDSAIGACKRAGARLLEWTSVCGYKTLCGEVDVKQKLSWTFIGLRSAFLTETRLADAENMRKIEC